MPSKTVVSRPEQCDAVVFDVDGTLVDSERDGHRVAFNAAFAEHGLPYHWDAEEYGHWLTIAGGRQRIIAFLESQGYELAEAAALATRLHAHKNALMRDYARAGSISARPGVRALLADLAETGVPLAIATTGTRQWVEPLVDGVFGLSMFDAVVTGTEIRTLKPDPAVYVETVRLLGVAPARAVAVEDSRNGLVSAVAAGLRCVVVTNDYTRGQGFTEAAAVYPAFAECRADRSGPLASVLPRD